MKHLLFALVWFVIASFEFYQGRTCAPWFWWAIIATVLNLEKLGREPVR